MIKRVAAVGAVIAVIVASAAVVRWRASYAPLQIDAEAVSFGDTIPYGVEHPGGAIQPGTLVSGDFQTVEDDEPEDNRQHVVTDYVDGKHVTYAVGIHNAGRVGVTVTGFELPQRNQFFLLETLEVRVGHRLRGGGTSVRHTTAFHPFTVHSGETRDVLIRSRMHACERNAPGGSGTIEGLTVRYRVLGLHRVKTLQGPLRIELRDPDAAGCPRGPFTSKEHGIEFNHENGWRAQQFSSEPHLVTYLSNVTLHDPCVDTSCADPLDTVPPNSVVSAWYDGPKGRIASENLFVAGQPAHKTYRRNGCPGIGDEEITVRFDNPALTTTYTMNACLRGPHLARLRRQVDAMLRSVHLV
ncbi:MAG: hypothetical protein QOG90_712 [Actinomycetota bacterium]